MAVMGKKCWAVCCGTIRFEYELDATLALLCEYRSRRLLDGIVISTWKGEVDRIVGLRENFEKLGIYLVESEPLDESIGKYINLNFARQAYQMNKGLDFVPDDVFVLRCRTDYTISNIDMFRPMLMGKCDLSIKHHSNFNLQFQYRLGVIRPHATDLFMNVDNCFLGYKTDIRKMCQLHMKEFIHDCQIGDPDHLWFYNFLSGYPLVDQIMSKFKRYFWKTTFAKAISSYAEREKDNFYFPVLFNRMYALYLCVLYCYMYPLNIRSDKPVHKFHLFEVFAPGKENLLNMYQDGGLCFGNVECVRMMIKGECFSSLGYNALYNEITRLMQFGCVDSVCINDGDIAEAKKWIEEKLQMNTTGFFKESTNYIYQSSPVPSGIKALKAVTTNIPENQRMEYMYTLMRGGHTGMYWRFFGYTGLVQELVKDISEKTFSHMVITASRTTWSYWLYLCSNLCLCGIDASYVFKRYKDVGSFVSFPFSTLRLSAFYLWEKYAQSHNLPSFAKKICDRIAQIYKVPESVKKDIYSLRDNDEKIITMAKYVVRENFKSYKQDMTVKILIEFLADQLGKEGFVKEVYEYASEIVMLRCYQYPFSIGREDAMANLMQAGRQVMDSREGELLAYLLLCEYSDADENEKKQIEEILLSMQEKMTLDSPCMKVYLANAPCNFIVGETLNVYHYTLICQLLAKKNLLSSSQFEMKINDRTMLMLMQVIYVFFCFAEKNSDIRYFTLKNGKEIWFHSERVLNHPYNSKFMRWRNSEGVLWPQGTRPARSPFAAFLRLENDKSILLSVEFCSPICMAKDRFFEAFDSWHMDKFQESDNIIRLKRKIYTVGKADDIRTIIQKAICEFRAIENYVLRAMDAAYAEPINEESLQKSFDKYYDEKAHSSILPMSQWLDLARIDIKNQGSEGNDLKITILNGEMCSITQPQWFSKDGTGYVLESDDKHLILELDCVQAGNLMIRLQGVDRRSHKGERLPLWVDYTRLAVNREVIFWEVKPCWHNENYKFTRPVAEGEKILVEISWTNHGYEKEELTKLVTLCDD